MKNILLVLSFVTFGLLCMAQPVDINLSNNVNQDNSFQPYSEIADKIIMTPENNFSSEKGGWEFVSLGNRNGLEYIQTIPEDGWTSKVRVRPEGGYIARYKVGYAGPDWPRYKYVSIYCLDYRESASESKAIIGAKISYEKGVASERKAVSDYMFKGESLSVGDAKTRDFLLSVADKNGDGYVSEDEAREITEIGYKGDYPHVIDGELARALTYFPNLQRLHVRGLGSDMEIAENLSFDLPNLTEFWMEELGHNHISILDLSKCRNLKTVNIDYSDISTLLLPDCGEARCVASRLKKLEFRTVDGRYVYNLKKLVVWDNDLKELPDMKFPKLEVLSIQSNKNLGGTLDLDVYSCDYLTELLAERTSLETLYINGLMDLKVLGLPSTLKKIVVPTGRELDTYKDSKGNQVSFKGIEVISAFPRW